MTGIVVIGMWNDHWCTAYKAWIDELAPRLNDWLRAARMGGAAIIFPGSPAAEWLPNTVPLRSRPCACGLTGTCIYDEPWTGPHPALEARPETSWMGAYALKSEYLAGIKRLLYVGTGVDHDVLFHPCGAVAMREHYDVVLVRDMLLSLHANPSIPLSHALSRYQIPSIMSEEAFA